MERDVARDDNELIRMLQGGNEGAFAEIMERYQSQIYNLCLGILKDHDDAEDSAQQAFINALKGVKGFMGRSSFKTWLYRIAINISMNRLKESKRIDGVRKEIRGGSSEGRAGWNPLEKVLGNEAQALAEKAMESLPEKQRTCVVLRIQHDLPVGEIAEIMGTRVGNVKVNLHHGIRKMREFMSQAGYGPQVQGEEI